MEMIATRDAYGKTLVKLGEIDPDIVVMDADLSKSTRTSWFHDSFPERFFNIGISEANMISAAAGMAIAGKKPYVSTFAIFATGRPWEQIRNSICVPNLNVKIAASHAGISVGADGASHQAIEDIGIMRILPNMRVFVPADGIETEKCLEAVHKSYGPAYIRLGRAKSPIFFSKDYKFKIGKGVILESGNDISIFATGWMLIEAVKARDILKKKGISAEIINISTIKPIDIKLIVNSAKKTGRVITVEEHLTIGGLGSAVSEVLSENYPVPIKRIGINDRFGESGEPDELFRYFGLTAENISSVAIRFLKTKF